MGAAALAIGVEVLRGQVQADYQPHYLDGIAILCAVAVASIVATINQARAQKEFRSLSQQRDDISVKVVREGEVKEVSIYEVVVGDVIYLNTGDRIPADGKLLRAVDLQVDESVLTGESMAVTKDAADPEVKASTTIAAGTGVMVVEAVGTKTEMGKLAATLVETEEAPTPLQERLSNLADRIGVFGLAAAILTFLALVLSGVIRGTLSLAAELATLDALLEFAIIAVTIVVVAVPEGLPLAVTISLAYSIQKMARDKSLVRKLQSCETMGAATVVCSDKTGTLTKNRMSLVRLWVGGRAVEDPAAEGATTSEEQRLFSEIAAVNSTAFLEHGEREIRYVGNPTECALLAQVEGWKQSYQQLRADADILHQFGFSSDRKRMSTLVRRSDGTLRLLVKGAPEVILERSSRVQDGDRSRELAASDREAVSAMVATLSGSGQRTLGLGYRDLPADFPTEGEDLATTAERLESELVFFALAGIADPVRPEVAGAIDASRRAGVEVKMVTGDNRIIAETIARELKLIGEGDQVMEGPEFRRLSDAELVPMLPRLRVLARSIPSDKHRLVGLLKQRGEVVAVTGDGTNDATALRDADVGFAMGIAGTEVAKEASDIVILDDNFASIVRAIQWGRSIFENIRKFLQFQLTVNVVALSTAFLAAVLGVGIPLNTVQLLWVNLLMDTLAALALAVEPPSPKLLEQKPHGRHAPLITKSMWASILGMGTLMVIVLLLAMRTDLLLPPEVTHPERLTFVFNTFVFMQLFNEVNARSTRFDRSVFEGLLSSRLFVVVVLSTAAIQVLIVQYGGAFFRTVPLSLDLWLRSVVIGAMVLFAGMLLRAVGRALPSAWFKEPERPAVLAQT
jgi:calcium-translocating P-type ATPase